MPKLRLCLCSLCKNLTHKDEDNIIRPGCLLELWKWKKHAADEELRSAELDHLLHQTLLTAVVDAGPREASLAARPRDKRDNTFWADSVSAVLESSVNVW